MSNALITLIYSKVVGSAMRKAVLIRMADRANDDGSGIYTSRTRIAAELECSRQTVFNVSKEMEAEGLIVVCGKKTSNKGTTTIYQISVRNVRLLPDAWPERPDLDTLDGGLGQDDEASMEKTFEANGASTTETLEGAGTSKSTPSNVNAIGKNHPYRTKNNNFDFRKARSDPEYRKDFEASESPQAKADRLLWEANRIRGKNPAQAKAMEEEAAEITRALVLAERENATEH